MPTALTSPKRTVQITVGIPYGGRWLPKSEPLPGRRASVVADPESLCFTRSEVICGGNFVPVRFVPYCHGVHQKVDDTPPEILVFYVTALELRQPEHHLISVNSVDVFFFFPKLRGQVFLFLLQFGQAGQESVRRNSFFNGLGDVVDTLFDLGESGRQFRDTGIFLQIPVRL